MAAHDAVADPVRYRWDADTEILSASIVDRRGGGSVATTVELEGTDGSWVTLELRAGRLCGMEVAVWPPVKARSILTPPAATQAGHATLPPALVGSALSDVEVDTMLAAESDRLERTFHLRVGTPRRSRAVRVGRDILLELDDADQLAGLWLLNVPPVPLHS
ncbi:MAG: hypothetical protein JO180_00510 [Gemmatirosa sp.]|nr:hypothetical protein [Gemmatirosa sp.]